MSRAIERLNEERKHIKKELPPGFFSKPLPKKSGTTVLPNELDLFRWICGVPGKKGTIWEGCTLRVYMFFPEDYPAVPPKVQFDPTLFHPNVYPSGSVCLSILSYEWKPSITIKEILLGLQVLLDEPNLKSPAQQEAFQLRREDLTAYNKRIRAIVEENPSSEFERRVKSIVMSGEFRTCPRPPPKNDEVTID